MLENKILARPLQTPTSLPAETVVRPEGVGQTLLPSSLPSSTGAGDSFTQAQVRPPVALNSSKAEQLPPQRAIWGDQGLPADEARQRALDARKVKLPQSGEVNLRNVQSTPAQLERLKAAIEAAKPSYNPEESGYNKYGMYVAAEEMLKTDFSGPQFEGMTAHDLMELVWFTDFGYEGVNGALWSRDPAKLAEAEDGIVRVSAAANRFPAHEGLVLRSDFYLGNGIRGNEQEALQDARGRAEQLRNDGFFVTKAFWSTTKAQTDEMKSRVSEGLDSTLHYEIVSKTGRDLHGVNPGRAEEEVLFLPGTLFRVVDVQENQVPKEGPGSNPLGVQIKVLLEEVPVDGQA